jgi:hypothetical protein
MEQADISIRDSTNSTTPWFRLITKLPPEFAVFLEIFEQRVVLFRVPIYKTH